MVVCHFYQQGRCRNGETCIFQHPSTAAQTPAAKPTLSVNARVFDPITVHTQNAPNRGPCRFFLQGACTRGNLCTWEHDTQAKITGASQVGITPPPPCKFFLQNRCNKGGSCVFSHLITPTPVVQNHGMASMPSPAIGPARSSQINSGIPTAPQEMSNNMISKVLRGATVTYGAGATVSEISLPSDFSAVSMGNIPANTSANDLRILLTGYGFSDIPMECISLHTDPRSLRQTADIKLADPDFSRKMLQAIGTSVTIDESEISVKSVQLASESESGSNRLQLESVLCTWHRPSISASVIYTTASVAKEAKATMEKRLGILNRRHQIFEYKAPCSVKIFNMHPRVDSGTLLPLLPNSRSIIRVNFSKRTHRLSSKQLEDVVKGKLGDIGTVIDWIITSKPEESKVKAVAKFASSQEARTASKELDGQKLDPSSDDILHVQQSFSVKISVLSTALLAVRPQLEAMKDTTRKNDFVNIKCYDNQNKSHTRIRVFGEEKEKVARVKSLVEQLLAGHVASDGTSPISDAFFFQETSSRFRSELMENHGVTITRDFNRTVMRLYGSSRNIKAAQNDLLEKSRQLASQSKVLILDSKALSAATKGAFRQVILTLGKDKVRLDIASNPKKIVINGSDQDVVHVEDILRSFDDTPADLGVGTLSIHENEEELCPVCWTPPEGPFRTSCSHVYCISCLESQCTSSSSFPIRCLGTSAKCNQPFNLSELKTGLTGPIYDSLLQNSLNIYVRTHPIEFQHCSTPECTRFYRTSSKENPRVFECDSCLTSICTSCRQTEHTGYSCSEWAAFLKAEADTGLEEYKKEHDIRGCPKCSSAIEKDGGCNHMTCQNCQAHICWFCMKTFNNGTDTYVHMQETHS
ncbi:hypothetical protein BS50DRAFT_401045 [Corynespora cassiicola Philippines]|uniref:Uncharacterized protein n=1 Tax=Corynespora cassiicola Philippines TaxID=1448308 RepID=A0A2T2NKF4_CORCC|nr:hypothetical protein BS50DRAFT_401045 [Corynespora cassiicola Philippines]